MGKSDPDHVTMSRSGSDFSGHTILDTLIAYTTYYLHYTIDHPIT